MTESIANFLIASGIVTVSSISAGISQGLTNQACFQAINVQPKAKDAISRLALLCSALIETVAILTVFIAILLLFDTSKPINGWYSDLAKIGIGIAMAGAGAAVGIISYLPSRAALFSVARQPFHAQWIFNFTLLTLSIIQTPLVLAFIISLFIKTQAGSVAHWADSLRLIGSGIAIGLGSIGPSIGLGLFAKTACQGIGTNRDASGPLLTFTFISQAIIESSVIFAMVTALALLLMKKDVTNELTGIALLCAGIATGLGMFGPGISSARTAAAACKQIIANPSLYGTISKTSIFSQGVIDTAAIYVLLGSLLFIFLT